MKFIENRIKLILLDADAGIGDIEPAIAIVFLAGQPHVAFVRVPNRIRHEILNDLGQEVRVAAYIRSAGLRREIQSFVLGLASKFRCQTIDQPLHRKLLEFRRYRTGIKAADIEQ